MEIWKDIEKFEDYQISNLGNVKSLSNEASKKERILKPLPTLKGYLRVALYKGKRPYFKSLHRLVAESFIPNPENKPQVNHKDGDKANNRLDNLEWCTYSENIKHAKENQLSAWGERNGNSKLTLCEVNEIREDKFLNQYQLAEKYNVSQSTIQRIKSNKGWKI